MPDYIGSIRAELAQGLPMNIVEARAFCNQVKGVLSEDEIATIKIDLSLNPTGSPIIEGTEGVRKYRVACGNKGKSNGARVIYYYHDREMPICLLAVYQKSEKISLTDVEKAAMRRYVREFVRVHRVRHMPRMIS